MGIDGVEAGHRLIGQDQARFLHQGARDRDALLLPARKLVGAFQRLVIHPERRQGINCDIAFMVGEDAKQLRPARRVIEAPGQHIGQHRKAPDQVEALEDHGALPAPGQKLGAAQTRDIPSVIQDLALAGVDQAVDHVEQGGFAGARAPEHRHHLAIRHRRGHMVHGGGLSEAARQAPQFQHRLSAGAARPGAAR